MSTFHIHMSLTCYLLVFTHSQIIAAVKLFSQGESLLAYKNETHESPNIWASLINFLKKKFEPIQWCMFMKVGISIISWWSKQKFLRIPD